MTRCRFFAIRTIVAQSLAGISRHRLNSATHGPPPNQPWIEPANLTPCKSGDWSFSLPPGVFGHSRAKPTAGVR